MKKVTQVIGHEFIEGFLSSLKHYGPKSLVIGVIDSVFSIGVKYESTINVVERFSKYVGINIEKDEYTLEEFLESFGDYSYEKLANDVFKNRQRTSTRNGILKAEAVVHYINILHDNNINTTKDLLEYKHIDKVKNEIIKIPGQKSGISFAYLMMLSGDTSLFKPDRHIYSFFEVYLGYGKLSESALKQKFDNQYKLIKEEYPIFTIRLLDSLIWTFMKNNSKIANRKETINSNLPFFMTNSSWYYFNEDDYKFYLTNNATIKAQESYERFYSFMNN
ncbi:MAG: hypothetical protein ACOCVF_03970 [bacterium]